MCTSNRPHHQNTVRLAAARDGQTLLEYTMITVILSAALVSGAIYLKRGVMGGIRNSADSIGAQFDPKDTTSSTTMTAVNDTLTVANYVISEDVQLDPDNDPSKLGDLGVMVTTSIVNEDQTTKTGTETVGPLGATKDVFK